MKKLLYIPIIFMLAWACGTKSDKASSTESTDTTISAEEMINETEIEVMDTVQDIKDAEEIEEETEDPTDTLLQE
jgi:hypothetical protein